MLAVGDHGDCVTVAGESLSGEGLLAAAGAVAADIAGAPAVALDATASLATVVGVVGGILAGVPVVPVPADAGPVEAGHIVADSGAVVVLGAEPPGWLAGTGVAHLPLDLRRRAAPPGPPTRDATALVLYTSGTTGPPKGVPVRRSAVAACVDGLARAWGWDGGDTTVHGLPLWHVHGLVVGVLGPLRLGGRVHHTGRPTPAAYAATGDLSPSRVYFGVPTVWARIAADPAAAAAMRGARLLVSGSAALPAPVATALGERAGQVPVERYGMTETLITLAAPAHGPRRVGWVGPAIAGTGTRVLDDDGAPVEPDGESVGDLVLAGPTVMEGYLGLEGATAEVLGADGWFRTGDVACVDADGWHRIVGRRATDLIKSGGYRIGAGEVEAALLGHPGVSEAAVVGAPDDDLGQVVVAYVVAEGVGPAELIDHVAAGLSAHKRPRRVVLLDSLPKNAMGKVQKRLLGG